MQRSQSDPSPLSCHRVTSRPAGVAATENRTNSDVTIVRCTNIDLIVSCRNACWLRIINWQVAEDNGVVIHIPLALTHTFLPCRPAYPEAWRQNFSLLLTKFLQLLSLAIFTTLSLFSLQPPRSTRSSSVITLSRPPTITSLKITDRSFRYASPRLWNQLPDLFLQPHHSRLDSPPHPLLNSFLSSSPLSSSINPSLFHSRLKTYLLNKSFPP